MLNLAAASLMALLLGGCAAAPPPTPVQYYEPEPTRHAPPIAPVQTRATKTKFDKKMQDIDAAIGDARNRIDREQAKESAH